MRVLVCGGRDFADKKLINRTLDCLYQQKTIRVIIEGDAGDKNFPPLYGADCLAGYWAQKNNIENLKFPVTRDNWNNIGPAAGPIRNRRMLIEGKPDIVVAFPGGKGTANMVKQARKRGVRVITIEGEL